MNASKDEVYQLGIIGYPLTHSFSPTYFNRKFLTLGINAHYNVWELEDISKVTILKSIEHLKGFNVTIPYKSAILPYLDRLDAHAQAVGAVNCVVVEEGKWIGYNTDIIGFEMSLKAFLSGKAPADVKAIKALVLGKGGAAKAVVHVLNKLQISFQYVIREYDGNYLNYSALTLDHIKAHHLLINTTPLGMFPNTASLPNIPYEGINTDHYLFDLVYNPLQTEFLKQGAKRGAHIMNGYQMLVAQAEANWDLWFAKFL